MKDWNWETIFTDNIGLYSTTAIFGQQRNGNRRKTQYKGYNDVQGHPRSSKVIEVGTNRKPVCDFLLVINSNGHLISYSFGDIAAYFSNFGHCVFEPPFGGLRDNVRCSSWAYWKARNGLPISVFSLGITDEADRQADKRTDRRTDRILIARPRLHSMQRGNNCWAY